MKLLDEKSQINDVADRWIAQYGHGTYCSDTRGRHVGKELLAINKESATASDVAEIIGNNSWVCEKSCSECGAESWNIVQIGEEPDYESHTANICRDCLVAAIALIDGDNHV